MRIGLILTVLGWGAMLSGPAHAQGSELHWYKGNTHAHTLNSDGDSAPDVVVRWYREHGYQFLFITDHGFITDVAALNALLGAPERFLILPGEEITQSRRRPANHPGKAAFDEAHVNALFTTKAVPPVGELEGEDNIPMCNHSDCVGRVDASVPMGTILETSVARVRAQGGIAQINHPNYVWSLRPQDLDNVPDGTLLEIWNGVGVANNLGGDDGQGDVRPSAEGFWDHALSRGRIVWGVGSDDSHWFAGVRATDPNGAIPGQAWIMVRAPELTPAAIEGAIARGEFYASNGVTLADISTDASGLTVTIVASQSDPRFVTRFVGQDGKVLAKVAGMRPSYRFQGNETYVRAIITDSNGKQAWTQPVFRDRR